MSDERSPDDRTIGAGKRPDQPVESRGMAARQRNIRMEDALWDAASEEAERLGMNTSEFVREAVAFRLGYRAAVEHKRETREIEAMLRRIMERGNGS